MNEHFHSWKFWWIFGQLLAGCACVFYRMMRSRRPEYTQPLRAWETSKLNFVIFLWFSGMFILGLIPRPTLAEAHTEYVIECVYQGVFLILLVFFARWNIFGYASGIRNGPVTFGKLIKVSMFSHFYLTPLVFALSAAWTLFLTFINHIGFHIPLEQQELLLLLESNPPLSWAIPVTFTAVAIAPTCEELLFRGGIYRFLKGKISPTPAALVTGAIFALLHWNWNAFLPLFFLSLFLTCLYERVGLLHAPIIVHGLLNANSIVLALLPE
ncbi:MAG: CPBP family intramembrane metalloprotease [Puniceicoccales bacterium]|jgi:membrane protease YdiL (CAAX protease family)|nr:CPBP family intramembrane metalloprotease [Puniceicoccales bacterium]